ncbi:hypothetical protein YC2023_020653 [Brassica napus]
MDKGKKTNKKRKESDSPTQSPKSKRKLPTRSLAWNVFTRLEDDDSRCSCNYCGKTYSCNPATEADKNNQEASSRLVPWVTMSLKALLGRYALWCFFCWTCFIQMKKSIQLFKNLFFIKLDQGRQRSIEFLDRDVALLYPKSERKRSNISLWLGGMVLKCGQEHHRTRTPTDPKISKASIINHT